MLEIEVKYRFETQEEFQLVKNLFLKLYAEKIYRSDSEEITDYYYFIDGPGSRRIRYCHRQNIYLFTEKGETHDEPSSGFKIREEYEEEISEPAEEKLAEAYLVINKHRDGYHWNNASIYFDEVEDLGLFIELEYLQEDDQLFSYDLQILNLFNNGLREDRSYRQLFEEKKHLTEE